MLFIPPGGAIVIRDVSLSILGQVAILGAWYGGNSTSVNEQLDSTDGRRNIATISPNRVNRAHWPTKENTQVLDIFWFFWSSFSVMARACRVRGYLSYAAHHR